MPATCASKASPTATAKSPAGSLAPKPRLTTTSLIIMTASLATCAPEIGNRFMLGSPHDSFDQGQTLPCFRFRVCALFLFAGSVELLEIGPQVLGLGLVLNAREDHLGVLDLGPRILD